MLIFKGEKINPVYKTPKRHRIGIGHGQNWSITTDIGQFQKYIRHWTHLNIATCIFRNNGAFDRKEVWPCLTFFFVAVDEFYRNLNFV